MHERDPRLVCKPSAALGVNPMDPSHGSLRGFIDAIREGLRSCIPVAQNAKALNSRQAAFRPFNHNLKEVPLVLLFRLDVSLLPILFSSLSHPTARSRGLIVLEIDLLPSFRIDIPRVVLSIIGRATNNRMCHNLCSCPSLTPTAQQSFLVTLWG